MNPAIIKLNKVLKEQKIRTKHLAIKLGLDYPHLTLSLKGKTNLSLKTYLDLLHEVGYEMEIKQIEKNNSD